MPALVGMDGDLPAHVLDLLRHDHARIEPRLDEMLAVLGRQGAREIWHKHGTRSTTTCSACGASSPPGASRPT